MTIRTLQDVADRLRKARATIPLPRDENTGTIESAMKTGLSIALVVVEEALESAAKAPTVISHFKLREVSATPEGPQAGGFVLGTERQAMRVKELEAEITEMRSAMTQDLLVAGRMRGDLEREVASLGNKHLLELCTELQERVAYAEKARDEALAEKDAALAKTKDKTKRMGRHIGRMIQALTFYADPETYFAIGFMGDPPHGPFLEDFEEIDGAHRPGKKARAALDETAAISPEDLEALRQAIREGVQDGLAPLKTFVEATGRVFTKAIEIGEKLRFCPHCNDTGVIETGNNDLPCEHCPKGQTAVFNVGGGQTQTGEQVLRSYNPPGNLRQPPSWKKTT